MYFFVQEKLRPHPPHFVPGGSKRFPVGFLLGSVPRQSVFSLESVCLGTVLTRTAVPRVLVSSSGSSGERLGSCLLFLRPLFFLPFPARSAVAVLLFGAKPTTNEPSSVTDWRLDSGGRVLTLSFSLSQAQTKKKPKLGTVHGCRTQEASQPGTLFG